MDSVLYCCIVPDRSESGDLVPELLSAMEYDFSSWRDAETGKLSHTLYFKTEEEAIRTAEKLEHLRGEWKEMDITLGEIAIRPLKKEDWAESWKLHFKPIEISAHLAITPTWIPFHPKPDQKVIVLDPGMSFGTGQHATTKFCLTQIDRFVQEQNAGVSGLSLLDAGCGSGILAIAAEKFGFGEIAAFDIDPDATRIAKENAAMNDDAGKIHFSTSALIDFNSEGIRYDVVAANILSSALLAGKDKLLSLLKPGGHLIIAGVLDKEYPIVRQAFEEAGCREYASTEEAQWRGGAFLRQKK